MAALTVAILLPPSVTAIGFVRGLGVKTTEALAYEWIATHVFPGSQFVSEARSLQLPYPRYQMESVRALTDRDPASYSAAGVQYLIASQAAFGPAFAEARRTPGPAEAYERIFATAVETQVFKPSDDHPGPEIRILKLRQ
jgi:hypothetical protein